MNLPQAPEQAPKTSKTFVLPIYWQQTKKKKVLVGMNAYRNWHYFTSNSFKQYFTQLVFDQIDGQKRIEGAYRLQARLYYKNANCDGSNVVALVEKVFLDALISAGIIVGDTVKHHLGTSWEVVDKDTSDPRCEITLQEDL